MYVNYQLVNEWFIPGSVPIVMEISEMLSVVNKFDMSCIEWINNFIIRMNEITLRTCVINKLFFIIVFPHHTYNTKTVLIYTPIFLHVVNFLNINKIELNCQFYF